MKELTKIKKELKEREIEFDRIEISENNSVFYQKCFNIVDELGNILDTIILKAPSKKEYQKNVKLNAYDNQITEIINELESNINDIPFED